MGANISPVGDPASATKRLFKIGAAEASGTAFRWLGDQRAVDFIFPGHNVGTERFSDGPEDKSVKLTGSSPATALASGLAAVILYCVQVAAKSGRAKGITMEDFRALKQHDRMRDAFLALGTTDESEKKYIAVWDRFRPVTKKAESEPRDRWVDVLATFSELWKIRHL